VPDELSMVHRQSAYLGVPDELSMVQRPGAYLGVPNELPMVQRQSVYHGVPDELSIIQWQGAYLGVPDELSIVQTKYVSRCSWWAVYSPDKVRISACLMCSLVQTKCVSRCRWCVASISYIPWIILPTIQYTFWLEARAHENQSWRKKCVGTKYSSSRHQEGLGALEKSRGEQGINSISNLLNRTETIPLIIWQ
jgi:hypothetical protein